MKQYALLAVIAVLSLSVNLSNAQEITAFPGFWGMEYYQDDQKISKEDLTSLFKTNTEVDELWNKANANATLAYISFAAEFGFAVWGGYAWANDDDVTIPAIGVVGTAVLASIFLSNANKKRKEAILKYNSSLEKKVSLGVNINEYGLGLAVRF
ncbi:MAG: hypothetical protein HKO90_03005 [Flavobacteriaceae bacterium]|nr:hypothetical protein [Bacteroidia bacterium]NNK87226.1 hypothetical protein [Flavobacteriaceae bacterium]